MQLASMGDGSAAPFAGDLASIDDSTFFQPRCEKEIRGGSSGSVTRVEAERSMFFMLMSCLIPPKMLTQSSGAATRVHSQNRRDQLPAVPPDLSTALWRKLFFSSRARRNPSFGPLSQIALPSLLEAL